MVASANAQTVGFRRLSGQCLVNDAPIWNVPTQTVSSLCEYLEVWAQGSAIGLAYIHPYSRSTALCTTCPLEQPLSSTTSTASSLPTPSPQDKHTTRMGALLLGVFVWLIGVAILVMKLTSKLSEWCGNDVCVCA